jgi:hypothetical protein
MSQAAVERALGKLVTDEAFRESFFHDPAAASFQAGLELSTAELDALMRLSVKAIASFSARLDARICRLHLEEADQAKSAERSAPETDRRMGGLGAVSGTVLRQREEEGAEPKDPLKHRA